MGMMLVLVLLWILTLLLGCASYFDVGIDSDYAFDLDDGFWLSFASRALSLEISYFKDLTWIFIFF